MRVGLQGRTVDVRLKDGAVYTGNLYTVSLSKPGMQIALKFARLKVRSVTYGCDAVAVAAVCRLCRRPFAPLPAISHTPSCVLYETMPGRAGKQQQRKHGRGATPTQYPHHLLDCFRRGLAPLAASPRRIPVVNHALCV